MKSLLEVVTFKANYCERTTPTNWAVLARIWLSCLIWEEAAVWWWWSQVKIVDICNTWRPLYWQVSSTCSCGADGQRVRSVREPLLLLAHLRVSVNVYKGGWVLCRTEGEDCHTGGDCCLGYIWFDIVSQIYAWGQRLIEQCSKNSLIITGGNKWSALKSTEVLDVASRQATLGGEMASPRFWFYIATVCNVQL